MNAIQDRVPVYSVEPVEVTLRSWIAIEHRLQIFRNFRLALRCVSGVPSSIEFGLFDLPQARRANATELDQYERPLAALPGGGLKPPADNDTRGRPR